MSVDRPSGDFGGTLRAARERRGVSLRQIANATKISVAILEGLERNDISKLPAGIFGRAFVRSYAIEVGLDPETTIQDFIAQFPADSVTAGHPASAQVEDHEAHESDRRMATTFVRLIAISVPIAAAVVYFGLAGREGAHPEAAPAAPLETAGRTPGAEPSVPSSSTPSSVPSPSPATPPPASPTPSPVSPPSTPAVPPASAPSAAPAATTPAAAPGSSTTPPVPAATVRLTVGLSVTRPCWVTAIVDGQRTIDRLLQPGEKQTIDVRREIALTAADAAAVTLTLNGAEARSLGKADDVVTVRLNPTNYRNYVVNR
jgi:cytoskeletal protein RodZ